ncbi:LacI family DNA-binding transcriptional regulator [Phytoactinopolyspora halotolerans]|uniref:LacI family transcriptional regulator n=1 Tax=Phytoactinopolyspora halotolerans TaxID=1981512 RepID=A0A6L9SBJ9_9ACTN|nr:LacI family DNA-binding transcriptional regulator [Phytoactinopolyspora halotolerans]NEE01921.1 LacI family transcriptional regulator [Phytoactinopolyspora halotolerans]
MAGVTIQHVAQAAGVSPTTVSNLLNGRANQMLPETRQRVEAAIERLGYRPNRAARHLRTGRSRTVGLVVPSVGNPFWGTFARYLEAAALTEGYNVLLCNSERDPDRERRYVEELWSDGVQGVVLCSSLPSLEHVMPLMDRGLQIVAFDRAAQANDADSLVSISIDNAVGSQLATTHLTSLGHRRLAFVSGALGSINRKERYRGFTAALEQAGLSTENTLWPGASGEQFGDVETAELGRRAARELLATDDPPTGIVAINDMCALGVCRGVRDAGLEVAKDVSVVGFDDIVLADLYDPPLTTVRQPMPEMAKAAIAELKSRVEGPGTGQGRSLLLRPELVVRQSSAPPRG